MNIKIRPAILVISVGLVTALIWAVAADNYEMVSVLAVALAAALSKLVESEEASSK